MPRVKGRYDNENFEQMGEEKQAFEPKSEDDIRDEVVEDLKGDNEDFDVEQSQEQIDRIVERRLKDEEFKASTHKKASERKTRLEELEEENAKLKGEDPSKGKGGEKGKKEKNEEEEEDFDTKYQRKRDDETLDDLGLSEDAKNEIKDLAKVKKVSVKKLVSSNSYVKNLIKEEQEEEETEEAGINGNNNKTKTKKDLSKKSMSDFDLSTEEGRKDYESYKKQTLK